MLYAVAFGTDTLSGDSAFHFEPIRIYAKHLDWKTLLQKWCRKNNCSLPETQPPSDSFHDTDTFDNDNELPVGFWIIDFKVKDAIERSLYGEYSHFGSDSAVYRANNSAKTLCSLLCVQTINRK